MKTLLIIFVIAALTACNKYNPSKYPTVTSASMKKAVAKMQPWYSVKLPEDIFSGPILTVYPYRGEVILRIDARRAIIDVDSTGKIIRAWGYSEPCVQSYYSERWPDKSNASAEAIMFYRGLQKGVIDYLTKG